jgi:Sec-independent protein translocase protein TatA
MIRKALAELKESIENLSLESEQPIKEEKKELPRLPKPKYQDEEDEESENEEDDSDEEETDSEDEDEYVPPKKYPKLPQKK